MDEATARASGDILDDDANRAGWSLLSDDGLAMRIADRVDSGKVHINEQTVSDEPNSPFGGVKDSGNGGRIGGHRANMDAFTEVQWLTVRPEIAPYPF